MPGQLGEPVVTTLVCFILFRTRGCGCSGHPAFPAPSLSWANGFANTRAHRAAGMWSRVDVIARSDLSAVAQRPKVEATKQSTLTSQQHGLLRGACHRAALCADPLARNDDKTIQARHRSADRRVAGAGR